MKLKSSEASSIDRDEMNLGLPYAALFCFLDIRSHVAWVGLELMM